MNARFIGGTLDGRVVDFDELPRVWRHEHTEREPGSLPSHSVKVVETIYALRQIKHGNGLVYFYYAPIEMTDEQVSSALGIGTEATS